MKTITANDFAGRNYRAPRFVVRPRRAAPIVIHAPAMATEALDTGSISGAALRFALALVPFSALSWLFIAV